MLDNAEKAELIEELKNALATIEYLKLDLKEKQELLAGYVELIKQMKEALGLK